MEPKERLNRLRRTLKMQLTIFEQEIAGERLDEITLVGRFKKITKHLEAYDQAQLECDDKDLGEEEIQEVTLILRRYHAIEARVHPNPVPAANIPNDSSIISNQTSMTERPIKLKRIEIPKFDGRLEKWLEFKKGFLTLIDARTDISDLEKHAYLRDALQGRALEVITLYSGDGSNYKLAWEALLEKYDRKRVLLARLLDAILDLTHSEDDSARGIQKLIRDTEAYLNMIDSFNEPHALTVRVIERLLPRRVREEWDRQLNSDDYPTLKELYKFLKEIDHRYSASEKLTTDIKDEPREKRKRTEPTALRPRKQQIVRPTRTFLTEIKRKCTLCKRNSHALFRCSRYGRMTPLERWTVVKSRRLCPNCLQRHVGNCPSPLCQICCRPHHTSLHRTDSNNHAENYESPSPKGEAVATASQTDSKTL
ncbi:uncharacterized protein LOC122522717 [Polistes fuscatus]|uniref:uncharacterized protein LOC122522717 n=1 Tax=Polistes fuscatus TaxID=30207 RepID=UPI001CA8349F|nr:uncharacterized protein LOC122522717 [Polistes fuscatus]